MVILMARFVRPFDPSTLRSGGSGAWLLIAGVLPGLTNADPVPVAPMPEVQWRSASAIRAAAIADRALR